MPINVCIDVDLTLIDEESELMGGAKEALAKLIEGGCELTLWSAAGAAYAKSVAVRHKLENFFEGFAGKPDLAIDDDPKSLLIRKTLLKHPEVNWGELQHQALRALKEIKEEI